MSIETSRVNLHNLLKGRVFDQVLLSTFNFDVRFFEEFALESMKGIASARNISVFLDRGEYEEIIAAAEKGGDWTPRLANLRYLLHPIGVPGVFHPKIFLLAARNHGLLIVGSANFSSGGLGANAEMVSSFAFEAGKNERFLPLFQAAFQFFDDLAERWPGENASASVAEMRSEIEWLSWEPPTGAEEACPTLLANLDRPLWEQMLERLPEDIKQVDVVSRFFDASPSLLDATMGKLPAAKIRLYTQARDNFLTPAWMGHPFHRSDRLKIFLGDYSDPENVRSLHAKAYAFTTSTQRFLACGSANFSSSALLRTAASGNLETLLLYPPTPKSAWNPAVFFDPQGSAREALRPEELTGGRGEPTEPTPRASPTPHLLGEAWVEDERRLRLKCYGDLSGKICRISQGNTRPEYLKIGASQSDSHLIDLGPPLARRILKTPTVVQVGTREGKEWIPATNPVLVAAIQDIGTGRDLRQERKFKEARESPERFMGVLRELCEGDDETRLLHFLTHCDLPFDGTFRLLRKRIERKPRDLSGRPGFRDLGDRGFRHFEVLHDAVVNFCERHQRRLQKHAENGTAQGIPNYLQILETILRLLLSQIERVVGGLAGENEPILTADNWHGIRQNLDAYYGILESLLKLTTDHYVAGLLESEERRVVTEGFGDSADEILGIYDQAIAYRGEIADLARSRLLVRTMTGLVKGTGFFKSRLADDKWPDYLKRIRECGQRFRSLEAA